MNDIISKMLAHRSIRAYTDEPVEDAALEMVIKAAQAAPSWVNLQLVSIIGIKNAKRRKLMAKLCGNQEQIAEAPVFLVFCADYYRVAKACEQHGQNFEAVLEDVDTVIVGAHEVGIALEAAVVAAESLGLGIVPIGDVRLHAKEMIAELELPKYVFPMLGLCMGHPAEDPGLKPRLPVKAVFFEDRYNTDTQKEMRAYNETYSQYLTRRPWNNRVGNWNELAADFYREPFHYKGVAAALAQQGFLSVNNCK